MYFWNWTTLNTSNLRCNTFFPIIYSQSPSLLLQIFWTGVLYNYLEWGIACSQNILGYAPLRLWGVCIIAVYTLNSQLPFTWLASINSLFPGPIVCHCLKLLTKWSLTRWNFATAMENCKWFQYHTRTLMWVLISSCSVFHLDMGLLTHDQALGSTLISPIKLTTL